MNKPIIYNLDSSIIIEIIRSNVKHFERVPNLKVVNWKDLG